MKLVTAVLRPDKVSAVQSALGEIGVYQATFTEAWGTGNERGQVLLYRGSKREVRLPRIKIEVAVEEDVVEALVEAIQLNCKTGQVGDGIILVAPLDGFVRIRTGQRKNGTDRRDPVHLPTNRIPPAKALAALS